VGHLERGDLGRARLLLLGALQSLVDDLQVGEDALGVEGLELALRVGAALRGGALEVANDEAERFLVADLLERLGREADRRSMRSSGTRTVPSRTSPP
jgi:hypothetical protein